MAMTGAEAILRSLRANGVDYLFANPGSDFAPVIETYALARGSGEIPECVTAAHENVCISMAHGYYLATGRMQATMVHTNVGLANAVMGLLNAHSDDVPIFLMSGRTPLTEHEREGSRQTPIQYGQEMRDQHAMVREAVKWDYELRYAENAADLVSRAAAIAQSEPVGSVYISLPREPLCEPVEHMPAAPVQVGASAPQPDPSAISAAAEALAGAQNPLIVCSRGDANGDVARELIALAEENSIAVSEVFVTRNIMPSDHPLNIGHELPKHLPQADVVLVVDSGVAWIEARTQPAPDAAVIHIGPDPLFSRMPVRSYRTTHAIQSNSAAGLAALRLAMPGVKDETRQAAIGERHAEFRRNMADLAARGAEGVANKAYVAQCVSNVLGDDGVVFNERGGPVVTFSIDGANRWFGNTQAGGLGWCLPAALGYQLAHRDRLTVCVIGDGCYMFANPVACHQVAEANDLPVLTVVLNNGSWDAVRLSTMEVYPDGAAATSNAPPMTEIRPTPDYAAIAASCGAHSERITAPEDLPAALEKAARIIREDRRQVVLDVLVAPQA